MHKITKIVMATIVTSSLLMTTACSSKIKGRGARTAPNEITKLCIVQNNGKRGSTIFEDEAIKAIATLGYQGALTDSVDTAKTDGCSHFIKYVSNHRNPDAVLAVHTGFYKIKEDGSVVRKADFKWAGKIYPSDDPKKAQEETQKIIRACVTGRGK